MRVNKLDLLSAEGFTLIELVVVISIIALMSLAVFANYSIIDNRGKILAAATKAKDDLSTAQNYSLLRKTDLNGTRTNGWGVHFDRQLSKYVLFADLNNDGLYDYPTTLLIHGSEVPASGSFTESSHIGGTVTVGGTASRVSSGGKPAGDGYWSFDGSGTLTVAATTSLNPVAQSFAFDLWLERTSSGSTQYVATKGSGGTLSFEIYKKTDDHLEAKIYNSSGTAYTLTSADSLTTGWHHLVVTKDVDLGFATMMIDGINVAKVAMTDSVRSSSADTLVLGTSWIGSMDEIRFTLGNPRWYEDFTVPSVLYSSDDEKIKETALPPEVAFERLLIDGSAVNSLDIYFDLVTYSAKANNATLTTSAGAKIKFN
ncbi:MAG: LamG-like jellyroll fold domain-containing protein, partial [Candidatus Amoebophilus sp.]